jgi:dTDP-4-dehydrorhamnose reductase
MNIIIFGSTGMLGSSVIKEFVKNPKFKLFATYQSKNKKNILVKNYSLNRVTFLKVNIANIDNFRLKKIISRMDVIINCIGLIKQKKNIKNYHKTMMKINALFPKRLNKLSKPKQKIYQIATDGVYDGYVGKYNEDELHSATDIYGLSKSKGEIIEKNFFNIRCSIIGNELTYDNSLISWFLNTKSNKINGYTNHLWNGVTNLVFAKILNFIIIKKINLPNKFHLVPKNEMSKYDILMFLKKIYKKDIIIKRYKKKQSINRTLTTNYKKLNLMLWKNCFKKQLTIKEIMRYI